MTDIQRIALTAGEPAGIGPDLCLYLALEAHDCDLVAIADPALLEARARQLQLDVTITETGVDSMPGPSRAGELRVLPVASATATVPGEADPRNAAYVLKTLDVAAQACLDRHFDAMVTAPVHKGVINDAGIDFTGHTEYLRDYCAVKQVVMMLATEEMRVALATTHLPLAEVSGALDQEGLAMTLRIINRDLSRYFGIGNPRILVCGLNPHAGEGGHLGREEIDIIQPALETVSAEGLAVLGPLPADTLFTPKYLDHADAVLAMYHDQGLPVLKHSGFGRAVNLTLGLPIVRTSVDHGTALDLAGRGTLDTGSMHAALRYAVELAANARQPA